MINFPASIGPESATIPISYLHPRFAQNLLCKVTGSCLGHSTQTIVSPGESAQISQLSTCYQLLREIIGE